MAIASTIPLAVGGWPTLVRADAAQSNIEALKSQSETTLRSRMVDPNSTQVSWPFRFTNAKLKGFLAPSTYGYWTCGTFNSRNRMGGYVGDNWFLVISDGQQVTSLDIGPGGVNVRCQNAVDTGLLTTNNSIAPSGPSYGFGLVDAPDGLYLQEVHEGSSAATTGLKTGMVIEAVNGIPLKGMDFSTRVAVLKAAEGEVALTVIGLGIVRLTKSGPAQYDAKPTTSDVDTYVRDFGAAFLVNMNPPKGERKANPPKPYGLMIVNLEKGGDFERFGFKSLDVIVSLDGKAVTVENQLRRAYDEIESGKEVDVQILRRLKPMTIKTKIP